MQQSQTDSLVRDGIVESFWTEFKACWDQVPNKGLFFGLLAGWLLLFQFFGNGTFGYIDTPSLFRWMWGAYNGSKETDDGHGNVVPLAVFILFWISRKELLSVQFRSWWPALLLVVGALGVHVVSYAVQQPRLSIIALFVGMYALMGVAWGPQWLKRSFVPFSMFVFAVPLGLQAEIITFPLRMFVTHIVHFFVTNILGFDVVRIGSGIYDASLTHKFDVAPACAGLRSIVATFMLAYGYGLYLFRPSWRWVVMLSSALPLAIIGNALRLTLIVVAAELGGVDHEARSRWGNYVHDSAFFSMLPYVPAIIGLALLGNWLSPKKAAPSEGGVS
jgi:exosortase